MLQGFRLTRLGRRYISTISRDEIPRAPKPITHTLDAKEQIERQKHQVCVNFKTFRLEKPDRDSWEFDIPKGWSREDKNEIVKLFRHKDYRVFNPLLFKFVFVHWGSNARFWTAAFAIAEYICLGCSVVGVTSFGIGLFILPSVGDGW